MPHRAARSLLATAAALLVACGGGDDGGGADGGNTGDSGSDAQGAAHITVTSFMDAEPSEVPFLAFQDGDGPWQALSGPGGAYEFDVTAGRYAVLWACPDFYVTKVEMVAATPAEADTLQAGCHSDNSAAAATVSVNLVGLNGEHVDVAWADVSATDRTADFLFPVYELGTHDLAAVRHPSMSLPDKIILRRAVPITADLDETFNYGTRGFAPSYFSITTNGATGSETTYALAVMHTSLGTKIPLNLDGDVASAYAGIPTAKQVTGDLHVVKVMAFDSPVETVRSAIYLAVAAGNVVLDLPPVWSVPQVDIANKVPYVQPSVTASPVDDAILYTFSFTQVDPLPNRVDTFRVTPGWLGSGPIDWTMPDVSDAAGWNNEWPLVDNVQTNWWVTAQWGVPLAELLPKYPSTFVHVPGIDKSTQYETSLRGSITP